MSNKESCGKKEPSQRKSNALSPASDEKSDHADTLCYNMKRRQNLKRLSVEIDTPRKRLKINSSSQEPDKIQEASYSNDNQITSQSPSSNGAKKDINNYADFKLKDIKLTNVRSKLDHDVLNLSSPKTARDVKPEAEGQAGEKKQPPLLAQREKTKKCKKKRNSKLRDSSEQRFSEKRERIPFSQDSNSNEIIKGTFECRRKISFKIPTKSHPALQKDSRKSETEQEEEEHRESPRASCSVVRHKPRRWFSESAHKQSVAEWKGTFHDERQQSIDSSSGEIATEKFEAIRSSVSSESTEDTDQEMQIVEELHAARVWRSVDLPVVPPSGELVSMDVDLVEDDAHSSAANTALDKKLLIVIDTNILMNHLKFVRILNTTEIPGFDRLILIIPWVVVQELDRMKEGKLLKYAQYKAIPAVHFINDSLKSKDRKLWGQSIQLASQKFYELRDENNDDRVLKCCLQYQELFPCSLVVLCTDDRNLRNKGLMSGVKSLSKEELSAELLDLSQNTEVCQQPCVSKQQLKAEAALLEESHEEEPTNSGLSIMLESIISDLEKSLGTALSSILETEMKIAFGNLWMEILYVKPPWTLIHLLRCFRKHWLAVFGLITEKNLLLTVESVYENLCKANNNAVDFTTVKFLLQDSKSLLHAFSTRSDYDGVLPRAFAEVDKLLQTFAEVKTTLEPNSSEHAVNKKQEDTCPVKSHSQESAVFSDSCLLQPSRHQEIWSVLENVWISICQNSMDVFQRLGSNSALSTSTVASLEEAFLYLQKLMAAVKDILEGIQRILAPDSNYQDVETLYNFLIKYEVNKNVRFTAQELHDCVSQTEYREKLTIGCRQLVEMAAAMQQCSASVYMEARHRGWCAGVHAQP
ncbi:transcriptional protein SWT1 [Lepus europaeus]|uniref:transcriptional protein SWT1 n=1 Tax=Lepus europaeus TaxID=9983 RepID=UPI002B4A5FAE|nr:transcriptional protein SWT1 [Lepus europaeus]XP_062067485.1 transcriptional protein SWT1 [Lepus europaeus]XP_062067486.1 transcriptional protein SWT1 [Lepus europaeus]